MSFGLSLFTTYEPFELSCVVENGEPVTVTWLGWAQGGCQGCWSDVLPRVLALNGRSVLGDKTVLELGAGCGVIGLLASRWAAHVDITDGDEEEVCLIGSNCTEHAPPGAHVAAHHLDWDAPAASAGLRGKRGYDVVLASQVVYQPQHIGSLANTIGHYMADGGYALLYNDAVASSSTQPACRALLDEGLAANGLVAEDLLRSGSLALPEGLLERLATDKPSAYLLRITRTAPKAVSQSA